ncbi:MAG: DEAD/DEAH box helicase, partial [Proteobacteria bacterium]|nr:DEAD/DEAH box helicase [Pseudomonadota bacterium]
MSRKTPREYQEECVQAHFDWFARNSEGNPLFVVPTGAGKSLVIAEFVRRSLNAWPGCRFLVPTHVKELVQQNYDEFVGHCGDEEWFDSATAGIYSAGIGRFDKGCAVVFCNVQSVAHKVSEIGRFDLVLVDEAHMIPKRGEGRYRTLIEDLTEVNPRLRVCGYTATHYRLDGGYLHQGDGRIFTDVAYEVRLEDLVPEFLSPVATKLPGDGQIDATAVPKSAGDYNLRALGEIAENAQCVADAVDDVVRRGADRKAWLFFATTVRHAELIAQRLQRKHRIGCDVVLGNMPKGERRAAIEAFRDGRIRALVNVGVLTTGFNAPRCDLLAIMRPTMSAALYVQMIGRGMRLFPGKK